MRTIWGDLDYNSQATIVRTGLILAYITVVLAFTAGFSLPLDGIIKWTGLAAVAAFCVALLLREPANAPALNRWDEGLFFAAINLLARALQ